LREKQVGPVLLDQSLDIRGQGLATSLCSSHQFSMERFRNVSNLDHDGHTPSMEHVRHMGKDVEPYDGGGRWDGWVSPQPPFPLDAHSSHGDYGCV